MTTHDSGFGQENMSGRCSRRSALRASAAGVSTAALGAAGFRAVQAQEATPVAPVVAAGEFSGLVDIDGRNMYLECQGEGEPTVILLTGYRTSGRYWTDDLLQPDNPRQMVMPGVAKATRVCTYDRPGTYAEVRGEIVPSRSDEISQPRTSMEVIEELHALLQVAEIPGPYILAAHSLGGFFARLYAATYPDEVVGLVLVDAFSEFLESVLPPDKFEALKKLNQAGGTDTVFEMEGYGEVETVPWGGDNEVMREAVTATPLPPMPLAVLAHGKPFALPDGYTDLTSEEMEGYLLATNEKQATLVPNARFWVAS